MTQQKIEIKPNYTQRLHLTPYMEQALFVMQLDRYALEKYVLKEINENPLLEIEYKDISKSARVSSHDFAELAHDESFSLTDYLMEQARLLSTKNYPLLEYCIYLLDENGYFKEEVQEIAEEYEVEKEEVEEILKQIQELEPSGVGGRTLQECLLIQAKRKYPDNQLLQVLIQDYIYEIAEHNLAEIVERTSRPCAEIEQAIALLQNLNPKPGNGFSHRNAGYIVPEFEVIVTEDNVRIVMFQDFSLRLSTIYDEQILYLEKEEKEKMQALMKRGNQLIQNIEKRAESLHRIVRVMVERQSGFFLQQKPLLKLRLCDISEMTNLHSSTICRIIKEKYYLLNNHLYPMNQLMSKGKEYSVDQIKFELGRILREEGMQYSDRLLTECLQKRGYPVSRRVVAKYRNELGFKTSYVRKGEAL
jgi:RNA polymerase sigma-54 factor